MPKPKHKPNQLSLSLSLSVDLDLLCKGPKLQKMKIRGYERYFCPLSVSKIQKNHAFVYDGGNRKREPLGYLSVDPQSISPYNFRGTRRVSPLASNRPRAVGFLKAREVRIPHG